MRILITGGAGLLGSTLIEHAPAEAEIHATYRSIPVVAPRSSRVELSSADGVAKAWREARPEMVIHTAYSMDAGERDIWQATANVVAACRAHGAELVYLSTDALLDGEHGPYAETAEPAPVHEYGRWKARAELHVREAMPDAAVVRTSLVTRLAPLDPRSAWIADSLHAGTPVKLFVDELRCPIAVDDLARQLWELAGLPARERAGVWHLAGPEAVSRHTLGLIVAAYEGLDPSGITPALSASAPLPRPRDLRLLTARADRALRTRASPIGELLMDRRRR
jgi:dTDP-4-dehydrorhamnose reductase